MDPNRAAEVQAWAAIAQTVLSALTFAIGVVITYLLYRGTNRLTKLQLLRANFDAWMTIDTFFLGNEGLLPMVGKLSSMKPGDDNAETQKKQIVCFLLLNPFYSYFYALKNGYVAAEMWGTFDGSLKPLLRDDDLFRLSQTEVFVEGFAAHCKELRKSLGLSVELPNKALQQTGGA
jgi:hypothetical protein